MLLVNNKRILTYKNKFYRCAYGKNGLVKNKIEGDECTPIGIFSLGKLYIRIDRIKDIKTNFKYQHITKTMAWSDDPKNQNYNKKNIISCGIRTGAPIDFREIYRAPVFLLLLRCGVPSFFPKG